ncbi:MAG: coenzyme F420-0:L-glutamate ligase [Candidatus Heimdallarchaeota archaeon]|nr:coenzyme F420-0:L-glutamate ligase [Candidatus Heimdallarchaeota archaeon]
MINIIPIEGLPLFHNEASIWKAFDEIVIPLLDESDVLIVAHTPFSRVRGPIFDHETLTPTKRAIDLARQTGKEATKVEAILRLSNVILKVGRNVIITENKAGIVCANGGADESNAGLGKIIGLPDDPDSLASEIRDYITQKSGKSLAIIISDTVGRALRRGAVNIAVGVAGIAAMRSEIGKLDLFGYEMRVSEIGTADELASAAELVQGQTNEGIPFVIIRGYDFNFPGEKTASVLNRPENERLFK